MRHVYGMSVMSRSKRVLPAVFVGRYRRTQLTFNYSQLARGICGCRGSYTLRTVSWSAANVQGTTLVLAAAFACCSAVIQVTKKLPQRGLGKRVQRLAWKEDSYWTVTAVKPSIVRSQLEFLSILLYQH